MDSQTVAAWVQAILQMDSQTVAAWVQALGSILAIGFGLWTVQRQHNLEIRRTREQQEAEKLETMQAIASVAINGWNLVSNAYDATRSVEEAEKYCKDTRRLQELTTAHAALQAVPLHSLSRASWVRHILNLTKCLADTKEVVHTIHMHLSVRSNTQRHCEKMTAIKHAADIAVEGIEADVQDLMERVHR